MNSLIGIFLGGSKRFEKVCWDVFGGTLLSWYQVGESDLKWKHVAYCEKGDYFSFS